MRLLAFAFTIVFVWTGPKRQEDLEADDLEILWLEV